MLVEYEKNTYIKETKNIEIKDDKNVFLYGKNPYDGFSTYFGIWSNGDYLIVATLISGRTINYEYFLNKNISTECYIKKYLESNNYVDTISKDVFKEQLKKVTSILEI